jgi:Tol biopolymer transport system component
VIIFGTSSTDSNNNLQTSVNYVNPDGTNLDGGSANPYESYDAHIGLATPNPQKAAFAFAYTADPTNVVYDIYSNATLTTTGATRLTSVGFSSVNSLQFSPDGTKIVFVASVGSDLTASSLYVMNADGTGIHTLDSADDCYVASDGVHIAYTRFDTVNQVGQIYLVNIDGTNLHAITSNTDDHFGVQLSKDVTRFAWSEAPTGGSYDIYTSAIDGSQLTKITSLNGDNGLTPTFSNDGTTVAYVDNASDTTKTGIYSVGINGLGTATVTLNPSTNSGIFWTSSTGILSRHHTAPMFGRSIHIAKMKRLGKWHGGGQ